MATGRPGASLPIRKSGFATKQEVVDAEAERRVEEQEKLQLASQGCCVVVASRPKTLAMLLEEFIREHAEKKLAPKTMERYRSRRSAVLAPQSLGVHAVVPAIGIELRKSDDIQVVDDRFDVRCGEGLTPERNPRTVQIGLFELFK